MDVSMAGNSMQKIAFDGSKGYMVAQGQKMDLPADMATKFAKKSEIFIRTVNNIINFMTYSRISQDIITN